MKNSEEKLPVYDVLNAGPRKRFTIMTDQGPMLVHNCILGLGYSTGAEKLKLALHNGQKRVDLPLEECQRIVRLFRDSYYKIPALWKQSQQALHSMYDGFDATIGVGIKLKVSGKDRTIELPNSMKIRYPDLQREQGKYGWEYTYQNRNFRKRIYGGAIVENVTQALARIIVAYQMCKIRQKLDERSAQLNDGKIRRVVHMVHDEVIVVIPEDEVAWCEKIMTEIMSTSPAWAKGLPLACEAGTGKNYGEAK